MEIGCLQQAIFYKSLIKVFYCIIVSEFIFTKDNVVTTCLLCHRMSATVVRVVHIIVEWNIQLEIVLEQTFNIIMTTFREFYFLLENVTDIIHQVELLSAHPTYHLALNLYGVRYVWRSAPWEWDGRTHWWKSTILLY